MPKVAGYDRESKCINMTALSCEQLRALALQTLAAAMEE